MEEDEAFATVKQLAEELVSKEIAKDRGSKHQEEEDSSEEEEESVQQLHCFNKGCTFAIIDKSQAAKLNEHKENCDHKVEACQGCGAMVKKKDYVMHNAVKRCSEKAQKRVRVQSARKISFDLREHRLQIKADRHLSEQSERSLIRAHQESQRADLPQRRRVQSAQPRLVSTAVEARMSSAAVNRSEVSRYSRNLMSAVDSCRTCTPKFTAPKLLQRRTSFTKCTHCNNWRRLSGKVAQSWTSHLF